MATVTETTDPIEIPKLPSGSVKDFIPYLSNNPETALGELLEPYKAFEGELRKVYAQQPAHEIAKDGTVNLVPIFAGHEQELKIRARSLGTESEADKEKYIMTLTGNDRKKNGARAVVSSFKDFQQNFNLFSESSLTDLNWDNVVAAGSAVTTALLPIPEKWAGSKKSMREYYHQRLAPASDVDLFLYGLNEEEAIEKIKQIERSIKDSIIHETTTIRTKNAITIASQYPTRHVQIVLRLYDSISQIITGFDVDCACAAYDGKQVYAAPRAVAAFITQCNTIDLTRRSPSYENRLSKYSHRGFEVYWPLLDRARIDPTIFERSFGRTQGLARLLILEKLPKTVDRESYMDQRRAERGRPAVPRSYRNQHRMCGNIKDQEEDEVAEWVDQEEVASYHTMTVPYGEKYTAAKINRLLYAKDLLLNAEWNQPKEREVHLHRHPCFFGTADEVIEDCCGYCPVPTTDEEVEIAEEEIKTNVSGRLKFIMDDPGRQEIGSFNPITDDEWTTMAYVGDTARLCQAIVDGDLEQVEDWCYQDGVDVNRRDYTGRTPLHLAVMASTPEVVQCLIDHGARLIARLVDGRTALHIAAARGSKEMVKALMDKSLANEEEEEEKVEARRAARKAGEKAGTKSSEDETSDKEGDSSEASEVTLESEDDESDSMTMGSFVKVDKEKEDPEAAVLEDSSDDPDVYDINVIAWDYGLSPLHLAILNGHLEVIALLATEYGADVLLPVKLVEPGTSNARGAIMTILLALSLPAQKAKEVVELLLSLGATSAQADMNRLTTLHYLVGQDRADILDVLLANDQPVALSVLNNVGFPSKWGEEISSPLSTAIENGYQKMVTKLLDLGATPTISFDDWIKAYITKNEWAKNRTSENNMEQYQSSCTQPIITAAGKELGTVVQDLLAHGADPATLDRRAYNVLKNHQNRNYQVCESLLDVVQSKLKLMREYKDPEEAFSPKKPETLRDETVYTRGLTVGTYKYWTALQDFRAQKRENDMAWENWNKREQPTREAGLDEKHAAIAKVIKELKKAEKTLIKAGAKTFDEMHPEVPKRIEHPQQGYQRSEPARYKTNLSFHVPDLNDVKRDGYFRLFEATWNNDLETVKALTLAPWASTYDNSMISPNVPLKVAVQDGNGFSPFSIAVLRGHRDLAKKIIEICATQYHEDDGLNSRQRWQMRTGDSDEGSHNGSDGEDGENLPIFSELVSDDFTIDNLGEVSNIVKSNVLPLTMIEWHCKPQRFLESEDVKTDQQSTLLAHAVYQDDMELLKYIIQLGAEQEALLAQEADDQKCYSVSIRVFQLAIRLGRTALLAELIKSSGAGIPFNEIIQRTGIEIKTKPRYYQGLSVGGKKRADWAQAPGDNTPVVEEKIPPLLQAAHEGCIESVEWFMSDAPLRRYNEFAEANSHDKRIKTLQGHKKGFTHTIGVWLNAKSDLTLHCAITYRPIETKNPSHLALIKHLVSVHPDYLEQKSSEGFTPLQVAVHANRLSIVSYLISCGANQRHRDKFGRNMVHSLLVHPKTWDAKNDVEVLNDMLKEFDKEAVEEMLVERAAVQPGALTPLAYWMAKITQYKKADIIEALSKYSSGEELGMINGEGDLPLHVAVKQGLSTMTSFLLSLNPSLLYRENATGRTPLEMSREIYIASCVEDPPKISSGYGQYYSGRYDYGSIIHRPTSSFLPPPKTEESKKRTWEICASVDEEMGEEKRKRRLVSLFEANEVAKRITGMKRGSGRGGRQLVVNGGLIDGEIKPDIVTKWMS